MLYLAAEAGSRNIGAARPLRLVWQQWGRQRPAEAFGEGGNEHRAGEDVSFAAAPDRDFDLPANFKGYGW